MAGRGDAHPNGLIRANSIHDGEQGRFQLLVTQGSAQVVCVFPNGTVRVHGTQDVTIDRDDQLLTIRGVA